MSTLLTIVIPTHNRPLLLIQAIESALASTTSTTEILVIDDGSEPAVNQASLQRRFGPQIKVHRNQTCMGIYQVRKKGCELASGQYVYQLDDDDRLVAGSLDIALAALIEHDLDVLYLNVEGFGERGEQFNRHQAAALERFMALAQPLTLAPQVDHLPHACTALLQLAPSALQHPLAKRQVWLDINNVRAMAYQVANDAGVVVDSTRSAGLLDALNDCEFALYASCLVKVGLYQRPCYLARCEGFRYFSNAKSNQQQLEANLLFKRRFYAMCRKLPSLKWVRKPAKSALAQVYFNAAWHALKQQGDKGAAFKLLRQSAQLALQLRVFKLAVNILFSSARSTKAISHG